ncbi:SH3-like domain-containing protein [Oxalobacteraceae bacterium GrIS 2.11]
MTFSHRATFYQRIILALALIAGLVPALVPSLATAQETTPPTAQNPDERLQVTDPYLEMHTGPGRGYPVFFVVPRGQGVWITLRHTDWYKVLTEEGKEGWVLRAQLESTLTAAGAQKPFRDILLDDYLNRKVQLGAAWGEFKSEPMLKIFTSYRLSETLSVEATVGQVQGVFSGTDLWHINLNAEPWSDQRISPFFGIGLGKFKNLPNQSLVGALPTKAQLANATFGVRYYLTERFILRADYTIYTAYVSDQRSIEYHAATAGISFFF